VTVLEWGYCRREVSAPSSAALEAPALAVMAFDAPQPSLAAPTWPGELVRTTPGRQVIPAAAPDSSFLVLAAETPAFVWPFGSDAARRDARHH